MSVAQQPNGRWRGRWRGPDGRERARVFDRKRDAEAWVAEQRRQARQGSWVDPANGRIVVADYAAQWMAAQSWRDSTRERVESVHRVHVVPTFGSMRLGAIRPSDVRAWIAGMVELGLTPRTVEANYHVLHSMLKAAVLDRVLASNPADGVRLPRKAHKLIVPLEPEQVEALAAAIRPDLEAAVWVAAGCGLRQGEVLGLTSDRVRWLHRELVVDRQLVTPQRGAPRFAPLKTERSSRVIPAPDAVLTVLAQHVEAFGPGVDGLVFHQEGRPWRRSRVSDAWRAARRTAGVAAKFHDLRHYCASSLIRAGVSVKGVQEVLGHATATETLNVYSHLWPADHDRARDAMSQALGVFADSARTADQV